MAVGSGGSGESPSREMENKNQLFGGRGHFNNCTEVLMARIEPATVVPELRKLANEQRDKTKKERVETLADTVDAALSEAEEVRNATRTLGMLNQTQRDSLHALIKEYSKMIDDADERSKMLSEAGQIMRRTS